MRFSSRVFCLFVDCFVDLQNVDVLMRPLLSKLESVIVGGSLRRNQ
jgi:hypothetical protein